jgi:phospholipid transport system substrate-binding protein
MRRRELIAAVAMTLAAAGVPQLVRAQSPAPGSSASVTEGGQFVSDLASRAVTQLTTGDLAMPERVSRFRGMLTEAFDVPGIGRFVLGRYWRLASESERAEYLKLFEDLIVQTYVQRFNDFSGAQLRVLQTRAGQDGDVIATLDASLPGKPAARFDVRMRRENEGFKIFDVVIEGISMSVTQRDDFAAVIQRNGGKVEGLLVSLREKTKGVQ